MTLAVQAEEKRAEARNRVLLTAVLAWGEDYRFTPDCLIRNINEQGAAVRLSYPLQLPTTLSLIELRSGRCHEARVAWRRGEFLGLAITSSRDLAQARAGDPQRQLWLDRQPRTQ